MAKPTPDDTTTAQLKESLPELSARADANATAQIAAIPGNADSAVIRAVPGQPWPEPPSGGRWVRNAKTGDLTCVDAGTQPPTEDERRARREQQREAALKAASTTTTAKE